MPNVLIRDMPADDLEEAKSAAAERGMSLQAYLRDIVHAQMVWRRRQATLAEIAESLRGQPSVSDEEQLAVLDAIDAAHAERAEQLATGRDRDS
jgi:uncharacterized damage-inducible protein DinB